MCHDQRLAWRLSYRVHVDLHDLPTGSIDIARGHQELMRTVQADIRSFVRSARRAGVGLPAGRGPEAREESPTHLCDLSGSCSFGFHGQTEDGQDATREGDGPRRCQVTVHVRAAEQSGHVHCKQASNEEAVKARMDLEVSSSPALKASEKPNQTQ